jgi:hypothetical protein
MEPIKPTYFRRGEQDLLLRALQYYVKSHQEMIQAAYVKYIGPGEGTKNATARAIFEDHKQHHNKAIKAADDLLDRFRNRDIFKEPT